eukprot:gene4008-5011_t
MEDVTPITTTTTTTSSVVGLNRIKEGDQVILDINNGEKFSVIKIKKGGKAKIGKTLVDLEGAIGQPFYSTFQVVSNGLQKISPQELDEAMMSLTTLNNSDSADNRNLTQNNTSQKLTQQEIIDMKEKGTDSNTIIKTLIENSSSFQTKTAYSQIKYLKKKMKKYSTLVKFIKPTPKSLTEAYYTKDPRKICNIRYDTFGQLLTMANIRTGGKVMVVETCMGLITGSIAYRMGGEGTILSGYIGKGPSLSIVNNFGFPSDTLNTIYPFNLDLVSKLNTSEEAVQQYITNNSKPLSAKTDTTTTTTASPTMTSKQSKKQKKNEEEGLIESVPGSKKNDTSPENLVKLVKEGVYSLVIVTKYSPLNVLLACLPHLNHSGTFVVFSQYMQPLVECHQFLHSNYLAINLAITEIWMREQQVLPSRTHPMMTMDGASGYILTGIKVIKNLLPSPSTSSPTISSPTTVNNGDQQQEESQKKRKRDDDENPTTTNTTTEATTEK